MLPLPEASLRSGSGFSIMAVHSWFDRLTMNG
jgi:hypothetical protein